MLLGPGEETVYCRYEEEHSQRHSGRDKNGHDPELGHLRRLSGERREPEDQETEKPGG